MQFQILENLKNLASGVIHFDKIPDAIRAISVGSRAFARAVMAYQEAYSLLVDGVIGPITMQSMEESAQNLPQIKKKEKPFPKISKSDSTKKTAKPKK